MKTLDVKPQSFVTAIRCDKCGKECHHTDEMEFVSIDHHCGYSTIDDDGKHVQVDLCFACFKELLGPYWRVKSDWIGALNESDSKMSTTRPAKQFLSWVAQEIAAMDARGDEAIPVAVIEQMNHLKRTSSEDQDWDQMAPVGREFGSPDYERLKQEDAAKFAADMNAWILDSEQYIGGEGFNADLKEFSGEVHNIQLALSEMGFDVTVEVAASVWINYSKSLCAGWMAGADTVASAARTLYLNYPRK